MPDGASAVQVGTALFLDPSGEALRAAALRRVLAEEMGGVECRDCIGQLQRFPNPAARVGELR